MKAIIGLGNPGNKYKFTKHNIGHLVIDEIARRKRARLNKKKFLSLVGQITVDGKTVFLIKPQTYMNLSGEALIALKKGLKLKLEDLLIVYDDADLREGSIRFRVNGASGGHNGLSSIIEELGTRGFTRLRVGIGRCNKGSDLEDYVLRPMSRTEHSSVTSVASAAAEAALYWVSYGITKAMNEFNAPKKAII